MVYRHCRWHWITLGQVVNSRNNLQQGIVGIHFMSHERAIKTIAEWWSYGALVSYKNVSKSFRRELEAKILVHAEDYRPLLAGGLIRIVGGYTTDTLKSIEYNSKIADQIIAVIEIMMKGLSVGSFLDFRRAYDVFRI